MCTLIGHVYSKELADQCGGGRSAFTRTSSVSISGGSRGTLSQACSGSISWPLIVIVYSNIVP